MAAQANQQQQDVLPPWLQHIPGEDEPPHDATVPVVVAEVKPALANKLIKQLASVAPLRDFHHVKRVRRTGEGRAVSLHVVLTPGSDPLALPEPLQQLVSQHGLEPVVTRVPAHAPRTKERWQQQQSVWPTSFHPPLPGSGAAAPPTTITPATATYIQQCFHVIVEKAVNACIFWHFFLSLSFSPSLFLPKPSLPPSSPLSVLHLFPLIPIHLPPTHPVLSSTSPLSSPPHPVASPSGPHSCYFSPSLFQGFNMAVIADPSNGQILASAQNPSASTIQRMKKMRKAHCTAAETTRTTEATATPATTAAVATPTTATSTTITKSPCKQAAKNCNPCASMGRSMCSNPYASTYGRKKKSAHGRLGHPLGHAVMSAIAAAAARDRALFPSEAAQDKTLFMDGGGEGSRGSFLGRDGSEAAEREETEREGEQGEGEQREEEQQQGEKQRGNLEVEGDEVRREAGVEVKGDGKSPPLKRQKGNNVQTPSEAAHSAVPPNAPPCAAVRPYLCTGFDAFMLHEPCIMCAMALVHQRVRRVFYAIPNLQGGALGSCWKLHGVKSLNHHYEVFRVGLERWAAAGSCME
ncbi:unnamed protein product [Closterium sp. Naga37s-1]|nr:unnamed protein product [Closterium sp. Naga37s-1]